MLQIYENGTPEIYVSDPQLIREIFVKNSNVFQYKVPVDVGHSIVNEMLVFLRGNLLKNQSYQIVELISELNLLLYKLNVIHFRSYKKWFESMQNTYCL